MNTGIETRGSMDRAELTEAKGSLFNPNHKAVEKTLVAVLIVFAIAATLFVASIIFDGMNWRALLFAVVLLSVCFSGRSSKPKRQL